jgi:hypothetical protein
LSGAWLLGKMNSGGTVRPEDDRQRGVALTKKTDSPKDRLKDILGGTDEDGPPEAAPGRRPGRPSGRLRGAAAGEGRGDRPCLFATPSVLSHGFK